MDPDRVGLLGFVFHILLQGCGRVSFIFGIFRFFRLPIQMAIGLYLASMLLIGTAASIAYFAEDFDYCNEFKFAVSAEKILPILREL